MCNIQHDVLYHIMLLSCIDMFHESMMLIDYHTEFWLSSEVSTRDPITAIISPRIIVGGLIMVEG